MATSIISLWEVKTANGSYSVEIEGIDKKAALREFKKQFPQAGKPSSIEIIAQQQEKPEAPNGNGNGETATATTPQKPEVVAIKPEVKQDEKPEKKPVKAHMEHDFIDYLPSKTIARTMIVIEGKRIDHNENVNTCATGIVYLRIGSKRFNFGQVKTDSMVLDESAFELPEKTNEMVTYEDVMALKLEAEKQWCKGVKEDLARQKKVSKSAKDAARRAKMQAIVDLL